MREKERKALVIGASSPGGLGEAVARRLHRDGAELIVSGRTMDRLEPLADALGGRAIACDVTDEASIAQLIDAAGPIDILVNAAGTTDAGRIANIARERVEAQLAMHVTANIMLLKHAHRTIRPGGSIVLFSSITATVAGEGLTAYGCAKAALEHLVRIAALEFGPKDVRVNAVAPGFSPTPMTEGIFAQPAIRDLYLRQSPLAGGAVSPKQVAATVAWLSDGLCFTTGDILQASGGAHLGAMPRLDELKAARRV